MTAGRSPLLCSSFRWSIGRTELARKQRRTEGYPRPYLYRLLGFIAPLRICSPPVRPEGHGAVENRLHAATRHIRTPYAHGLWSTPTSQYPDPWTGGVAVLTVVQPQQAERSHRPVQPCERPSEWQRPHHPTNRE